MYIRYVGTNNPNVKIYYVDDLIEYNLMKLSSINQAKKYYLSINGIFNGILLEEPDFLKNKNIKLIRQENISDLYRPECQSLEIELVNNIIIIESNSLIKNIGYKYDKKINDLYKNISEIVKELKKDLYIKNEKIRNLELKIHFIESQIDKKVKIDYKYIKEKNKILNNEFKRVAKLMKLNI